MKNETTTWTAQRVCISNDGRGQTKTRCTNLGTFSTLEEAKAAVDANVAKFQAKDADAFTDGAPWALDSGGFPCRSANDDLFWFVKQND